MDQPHLDVLTADPVDGERHAVVGQEGGELAAGFQVGLDGALGFLIRPEGHLPRAEQFVDRECAAYVGGGCAGGHVRIPF
jgi:hypothetical protein